MSRYHTSKAKTMAELAKLAVLEEAGDEILYHSRYGKSGTLSANTKECVWSVGGTRTCLFTEQTHQIVSTSANDTLTGTGTQLVAIEGLDGNYNIVKEVVAMNGTTPVTLANKYMRMEEVTSIQTGSGQVNAGTITVTETGGSTVQAQIEVGVGNSQMAIITIPAGYTGLTSLSLASVYRSGVSTGERRGEIEISALLSNGSILQVQHFGISNVGTGLFFGEYNHPFVTPEKTQVAYSFTSETNSTVCSVVFNIILIKGKWNENHDYLF